MIIGIGHDLTDVARVSEMLESKLRDRFMQRILTPGERKACSAYGGPRLHQYVAGRFAAKEAIAKSFGCGIGALLGFGDMDIGRDAAGKPVCKLSAEAWDRLGLSEADTVIHITITHERALASAFAVVERIKL
ncbi:holo-[acyl-carrier-protein] synthase [Paenibacillus sp. 1011MAR3C5]|uniref:holo-ACP synthase n=1 Tax=Paenibacillus sp. 1011MAR3C5 TaxID=1675787 RepID=UPI000E6D427C|nr:holo-ACP synthase [Paenibacillus sp. 1011MAR3C5]RJE88850.1 holo-[acyl-carrier-protein] synthase [Paenibacillus sp. 1011MAR3C5]